VTGAGLGLVGRGCLCCESALGATAWLSNCGILPQMMPEYSTVYRITDHPTEGLWFAASGLVPLVVGVVLAWGKRRWRWKQPGWLFCGGLIAFGIVWCGVVMLTNLRDEIAAREAYRAGNYGVVAGVVTDFKPMSANGHGSQECFTVKGREFCYSGYVIAPGFRNSASRGGPVRAGERVKVAYWNGVILGLEIAMADLPTPDERNATVAVADQESAMEACDAPLGAAAESTSYAIWVPLVFCGELCWGLVGPDRATAWAAFKSRGGWADARDGGVDVCCGGRDERVRVVAGGAA
jgi:hypothetical protein